MIVERARTPRGELVLRRVGADFEIISNGTFLMDTRDGRSERLLVAAALDAWAGSGARVLIGGLGVGFSLVAARADDRVGRVTVVEREQPVVDWHATHLAPFSAGALTDPRVDVVRADLADVLADVDPGAFDVICLDVDNGPHWTVTPDNAALYGPDGLDRLGRALAPGGVLAVWSAGAAAGFERLLRDRFRSVDVRAVEVPRGEPDLIYLASAVCPRV